MGKFKTRKIGPSHYVVIPADGNESESGCSVISLIRRYESYALVINSNYGKWETDWYDADSKVSFLKSLGDLMMPRAARIFNADRHFLLEESKQQCIDHMKRIDAAVKEKNYDIHIGCIFGEMEHIKADNVESFTASVNRIMSTQYFFDETVPYVTGIEPGFISFFHDHWPHLATMWNKEAAAESI